MRRCAWLGCFVAVSAWAARIDVAPSTVAGWEAIESAQAGDEVVLAAGTYAYRVYLSHAASAANPITIRAADPANPPVFDLSGAPASSFPGSYTMGDRGRGLFQVAGPGYVLEGLVLRGCNDSTGCAGVRLRGVSDVLVRGCTIEATDVGIEGTAERLSIEHTQISSARTFGVHLYGGTAVVKYSLIRDSGQINVQSGARELTIESSWIARAGGHSLQAGGCTEACGGAGTAAVTSTLRLAGNVFVFGAQTNTSKLLTLEGGASTDQTGVVRDVEARVAFNTFVGAAGVSEHLLQVSDTVTGARVLLENNAISGFGGVLRVTAPGAVTLDGGGNWATTGTDSNGLANTKLGASAGFGEAFRLSEQSALRGAAVAGVIAAPRDEYFRDESERCMYRSRAGAHDVGAFEHSTTGAGVGPFDSSAPTEMPRWARVGCSAAGGDLLLALALFSLRARPRRHQGIGSFSHRVNVPPDCPSIAASSP